jgi:hypothetical protein
MSKRHEPHYVDAPALHKLGAIFLLIFVLILWGMHVLWQHVHPGALSTRPSVIPPQPRLQVVAPADRHAQYAAQARQLNGYGWVDPAHRVARIPIERAMSLLATQSKQDGGGAVP